MPGVLIVIELELVLFTGSSEHDPQQDPRPHIESGQLHKHLSLGLSHFSQPRPVHFLVSGFDYPVADPKEVFAWIGPKDIFGLDFSGLEDGFLGLFVEFLGHDLKFFSGLGQGCFLVL